jgi:hypothetical protein
MTNKPQLKPEDLRKKTSTSNFDPVLTEPVPDEWLEPLVRELYGQVEQEQEPRKSAQEETEPQDLDDPTS